MIQRRFLLVTIGLCLILMAVAVTPSAAQTVNPIVNVSPQVSTDGSVSIDSVYSAVPGFVVIHADNNGKPGRVAGFVPVAPGWNYDLTIPIDPAVATPTLHATLHVDDGQPGVYEFDGLSGIDNPMIHDGRIVTTPFDVTLLITRDQFVADGKIVVTSVTAQQDGWLVVSGDASGAAGSEIGKERVLAGTNSNVEVELDPAPTTGVVTVTLHVDTGAAGDYEFGTVDGADLPVSVDGVRASAPLWIVPHIRAASQIVVGGDGQAAPTASVTVESVLATDPGWLVVQAEQNNLPGQIAGMIPVPAGLSTNLTVDNLDPAKLTPRLWLVLYEDTGTVGTFDYGSAANVDNPVTVDGAVVATPIASAPSLSVQDQIPLEGDSASTVRVVIDEALIDQPGWLAITDSQDGAPGSVLATASLHAGSNRHVVVPIRAAAGDQIRVQLYYDAGTAGTFESADPPVKVSGQEVVAALTLLAAPPTPEATICTITASGLVNRRSGAGTGFASLGRLTAGETATVTGQTLGTDGYVWWQTDDGSWVRSDVVTASAACASVPTLGGWIGSLWRRVGDGAPAQINR